MSTKERYSMASVESELPPAEAELAALAARQAQAVAGLADAIERALR